MNAEDSNQHHQHHFDHQLALTLLATVGEPVVPVEFHQGDFCADCGKRVGSLGADLNGKRQTQN